MDEYEIYPSEDMADADEWERRREAEREAQVRPFAELRAQINEQDELLAEALYEVTMMKFGMEE